MVILITLCGAMANQTGTPTWIIPPACAGQSNCPLIEYGCQPNIEDILVYVGF